MRSARMDGFCAGEPWNARAIADELGYTAITSQEIWPDHPEKVLAFTEDFAAQHPATVVAALKALYEASVWLDDPLNRTDAATLLARPEYLDCSPAWIAARLNETTIYGDGRTAPNAHPLTFSKGNANRPRSSHAIWFLTQFRRWGLHYGKPDYAGIAARVIRPELFETALSELGVNTPSPLGGAETLFDGKVFDPTEPEIYANSFSLHNLVN